MLDELKRIVGANNVCCEPRYLEDYRRILPSVAAQTVKPNDLEQVAAVVKLAAANGIGLVPQGGNTGLVGGSIPQDRSHLVVSSERLNRIRFLGDERVIAEAGCTLAEVRRAAAEVGRQLPLRLASEGSCTIGGVVSTNAGGANVIAYGSTRGLVLGLEVVTADGETVSNLSRPLKDNSGYHWSGCFIGAEGTLGIITAAAMRLLPRPKCEVTAWLATAEPWAAATALKERLHGFVTALELVNRQAMELGVAYIGGHRGERTGEPFAPPPQGDYNILLEVAAHQDEVPLAEMTATALADLGEAVIAQNPRQAERLWRFRDCISEAQRAAGFGIKHDIALPTVGQLPKFLAAADEVLALPSDWRVICFGHLGDCSLHYNLQCPPTFSKKEFLRVREVHNSKVHELVTKMGGSISAEHGIGRYYRRQLRRLKPKAEYSLLKRLKASLDPQNIMNPGVLFD